MAKSYTFIFGQTFTPYHTQSLYKDRVQRDDDMNFVQVLELIENEFRLMNQQTTISIPPDVDSTINQIYDVIHRIKENPNERNLVIEFRQYLETLTFLGYKMFLFRTDGLSDEIPLGYEAYLYDTNDDLVPDVANIATAWVQLYTNKGDANVSNVVMQFFNDLISVNNFTAGVIQLSMLKDKFNKLNEIGDGYMFDVSGLLNFLEGSGYRVQIIL